MAEVDVGNQGRPERRRAQEGLTRRHVITGLTFTTWALLLSQVQAKDNGQWELTDPVIREWFRTLKRPGTNYSCCDLSDAYWADKTFVKDNKVYAVITDDRDDAPLGRPHVDIGTVIEVPDEVLKWDRGNPTGHNVIFLTVNQEPLCFVQTGGA